MFHGGGPPAGRYPRQYAPRCRIPTPFDQPQGPSMASGFGPQFGPASYRPGVPCGPFVPPPYERHPFPHFYHDNLEECRRSSTGPCGGPSGENIGRQLFPIQQPLPCAGFSVDQTQLSQFPDSRNPLSQEDLENERAGEAFLRCLATKEKYSMCDRAGDRGDRGDPHFRPPGTANGPGQELSADDQACKRQILGRSKSRPRSRSRSRGKSVGRSKSRPRTRSRSRGKSMGRSKSRPRTRSRSRGKSVGRSKSRPRTRSRSRGKSVGRSKSRPPSPSRAKSVGRSKSRPCSRSRSRGKSPGKNCSQRAGRDPSRSCSGTSSSSSVSSTIPVGGTGRTAPPAKKSALDMFRELLLAGQVKEREELLTSSKMAALKKQLDTVCHSQVSTQTRHSPVNILGEHQGSSLPRETQSLLGAMTKGMEPSFLASIQGQMREQPHGQRVPALREDFNTGQYAKKVKQETEEENDVDFLLPHERVRHDNSGFSRILGVMGNLPNLQKKKIFTDIEDEEKFLYGDEDDKGKVSAKTVAGEKQAVVDFDKIKNALTTIGLDLGKAEISKMMARTQEHTAESPHHKGTSSSGGLSPSLSRSHKRNRSPNSDISSNSHSSAKQALYCGAPPGLVGSEFDTSSQDKQPGGIPFFRPDTVHKPLMTTNMQTPPLGSEKTAVWGQTQLNMENYWPQKPNSSVPHAPAADLQILGLGSLKQVLKSVKATNKALGMDNVVDLVNQSSRVRTSQRQKNSEENSKVKEEALKTDVQEQIKRKDYLLKELESLLKREVSEFVVPVIGFCCQLCEEFFGDVTSARDHATCQSHKEKCKKHVRAHDKLGGNLQVRPAVDTERRSPRDSEHKWTSKEESRGYGGIVEKVSVKEDKVDLSRPAKVVPSKMAERKGTDSAKSSVTDHGKGASSKAQKKKKRKEKKRLKKEKKERKKEKKGRDRT